jgi:autoinducer 2-degrading protein
MLVRLVKMTFRPEAVEDFLRLFESYQAYVRTFPGCAGLMLLRDADRPNLFFTQSQWVNAEALELYRKSERFRSTWQQTKEYFEAPAEAWSVVSVEV